MVVLCLAVPCMWCNMYVCEACLSFSECSLRGDSEAVGTFLATTAQQRLLCSSASLPHTLGCCVRLPTSHRSVCTSACNAVHCRRSVHPNLSTQLGHSVTASSRSAVL